MSLVLEGYGPSRYTLTSDVCKWFSSLPVALSDAMLESKTPTVCSCGGLLVEDTRPVTWDAGTQCM